VKKYPKMRCPVCGMVVWFRNLVGFHPIDSFVYTFGIGKGKILVEKQSIPEGLIEYWIKRLKEVIAYLESLKVIKTPIEIPIYSSALEISVLPKMELKSKSTEKLILNVQKPSLTICSHKVKK